MKAHTAFLQNKWERWSRGPVRPTSRAGLGDRLVPITPTRNLGQFRATAAPGAAPAQPAAAPGTQPPILQPDERQVDKCFELLRSKECME